MREILFRAKIKDTDEWVEGYYIYDYAHDAHFIFKNQLICPNCVNDKKTDFSLCDYEINPETLCQFTGLTDKNGKRIWENDIVKHEISDTIGTVKWYAEDYIGWCVNDVQIDEQRFTDEMWGECDVIGNVFDDKHLLAETDYCREQEKETED